MQGARPDDATKENYVLETVLGRRLRVGNSKKFVDVCSEGGGKMRFRRRWDAVLAI